MSVRIIGAGLAGLLAGAMLKHKDSQIYEAQADLPNNHSAILRFRSTVVGDVLNIPFKKVSMLKSYAPWMNPVADALAYARKCTGISRNDRSIISAVPETNERFIAPDNLIMQMANRNNPIKYNTRVASKDELLMAGGPIVSTMPMPALMKHLEYPHQPEFHYVHGFNLRARLDKVEAFVTLYIPNPALKFNRVSITGNELIAEYALPGYPSADMLDTMKSCEPMEEAMRALQLLGMGGHIGVIEAELRPQKFAKILPIDDGERKRFIAWATDEFKIFSLGRFATWRPGLLLDDLVNDVRLIDRWLVDGYEVKKHR
jgi:hypothetical protein